MMRNLTKQQTGFTLVEMIMVIVITGIIGGIVAMFLKAPIQQYMDVARRAELTDIADTAVRRMARDVRIAVPNSVRTAGCGGTPCVEFLPTRDGGRYRANVDSTDDVCPETASDDDVLSFSSNDTCFEILGPEITFASGVAPDYAGADRIVVGSTQSDGKPAYDNTETGILRAYTGVGGSRSMVDIVGVQFPAFAELDSQRFAVVPGDQQAVTYACVGTLGTLNANQDGQAKLMRYWGYGFHSEQQTPTAIAAHTSPITAHSEAVLADKVSACEITYEVPNQRFGLLAVRLTLTSNNEHVTLYNEIHVNNAP